MTIADSQCPVWRARGCSKLRKNKHEYTVTRSANDQSIRPQAWPANSYYYDITIHIVSGRILLPRQRDTRDITSLAVCQSETPIIVRFSQLTQWLLCVRFFTLEQRLLCHSNSVYHLISDCTLQCAKSFLTVFTSCTIDHNNAALCFETILSIFLINDDRVY